MEGGSAAAGEGRLTSGLEAVPSLAAAPLRSSYIAAAVGVRVHALLCLPACLPLWLAAQVAAALKAGSEMHQAVLLLRRYSLGELQCPPTHPLEPAAGLH